MELSAYRIAQEALTNVTKHAAGARARVEIGCGPTDLTVTVTDDGGQSAAPDPAGRRRADSACPACGSEPNCSAAR